MFGIVVFVAYMIVGAVTARRYYGRRHGVPYTANSPGRLGATLRGFGWPVTLFMESTRSPALCNHHEHILERARWRDHFAEVNRLRQEERGR
jgi:hypothetical protein